MIAYVILIYGCLRFLPKLTSIWCANAHLQAGTLMIFQKSVAILAQVILLARAWPIRRRIPQYSLGGCFCVC